MRDLLPAMIIALFFWCMVDYRLHWLAGLITAALIADMIKEALHAGN